jgi:heptosyltransferase-2
MRLSRAQIRQTEKLLIRSTNWIGDAVMITPAVHAIRSHFPRARISVLAKPWVAPVFTGSPDVDEVILYEETGIAAAVRVARKLRRRRFDAAFLLQHAFEAALIAFLAGIPIRIGYRRDGRGPLLTHPVPCPPSIRAVHQTDYYLNILREVGLGAFDRDLRLRVPPENLQRAREMLFDCGVSNSVPVVGINPSAAYGPAKQWFPERFAALADRLQERYRYEVILFGGPSDRRLGERIAEMTQKKVINLAGRTRLQDAIALIALCRLFVTNDSGLMHVAAGLGVPLVAIFGSTNPVTTGPWSKNSRVVRASVPCSPCLKPDCREGHLSCMRRIEVSMVLDAVEQLLQTRAIGRSPNRSN